MVLDNSTEFEYYSSDIDSIILTFDCGKCGKQTEKWGRYGK